MERLNNEVYILIGVYVDYIRIYDYHLCKSKMWFHYGKQLELPSGRHHTELANSGAVLRRRQEKLSRKYNSNY